MIHNRFVVFLMALFSIAALLVTALLLRSIASHPLKQNTVAAAPAESEFSASLALEEKALSLPPSSVAVRYSGQFECPLKVQSEALQPAGSSASRRAPAPTRPQLSLKGILFKSSPLAIVENTGGKTAILAVGDTISGQTITAIGKASVTFRDKHGTWDLSVKE
jgi:type II secretory pathway component PulC